MSTNTFEAGFADAMNVAQWREVLQSQEVTISEQRQQIETLTNKVQSLVRRIEWFERQVFGKKSERVIENGLQLNLGETFPLPEAPGPVAEKRVESHTRSVAKTDMAQSGEAVAFFDETRVPMETITLKAPEQTELTPDQYEVISEKVSYRLAQRPASYVVLKYVRPVIKLRDTQTLVCAAAPAGVLEGSRAEVSFVAGLLVEKFAYHLPLYRQHQRLGDSGFNVSRAWLTQLGQQGIELLRPIYGAQLESICVSRVKAMDETGIKAGRTGTGTMKQGYLWPVYGEHDEVCFPFFPTRAADCVEAVLGLKKPGSDAVLLTDGYSVYERYTQKTGITHAHCWAHARREVFEAESSDPENAAEALRQIRRLYEIEEDIREQKLKGENKRVHRLTHSKPQVEEFFAWIDTYFAKHGLRPSTPFTKALAYARNLRGGLEVFLTDPDVPVDTNHLERALRPIPLGRKNWNFCWTELGAEHVGIIQSLIVTCRLHTVDPYTYLVDVLQRVGQHPAARVAELTPRLWKQHFASSPLRSDLYHPGK
jgi:transposase